MLPLLARIIACASAALAACNGAGNSAGNGAGNAAGSGDQDSSGAGGCPNDLPESCPSPEPSFAADVAPIFQARCAPCHAKGGQAAGKPLASHDDIHALRSAVLNQVYACKMPPPAAEPLTGEERATLLAWLVCGAKDN